MQNFLPDWNSGRNHGDKSVSSTGPVGVPEMNLIQAFAIHIPRGQTSGAGVNAVQRVSMMVFQSGRVNSRSSLE